MHNWWCLQSGHNASLSCQRHELQQRHREAANASQMEHVKAQLEALLAEAAAECAADVDALAADEGVPRVVPVRSVRSPDAAASGDRTACATQPHGTDASRKQRAPDGGRVRSRSTRTAP